VVAALAATLVVGATVQGMVGLGVGLVSAPVVTLLAPELMPGLLLFMGFFTPAFTLAADRSDIDWRGLGWSLPFRVPGTVAGVLLVAVVDERALGIAVGAMVLVSVLVTWRTLEVPLTRLNLSVAGMVSGVTGTATSIGGPPIAVLYQHERATRIRNTLAVYFAVGAVFSLVGLAIAGRITRAEIGLAFLFLPALVAGLWLAGVLRRRLPTDSIRTGVLVLCAVSAAALLVRSVV
jgi:uncharacterized membrane protein YfcA